MYYQELINKYYPNINILDGLVPKKTTFRVNNLKSDVEEIEAILNSNNIKYNKVDFFQDAFILEDDIDIRELDIYKEGKIYVQSLSSMLPPLYFDYKEKDSIIDMAAAPGGKTSEIASITNDTVLITAVEKNKLRGEKLIYNLDKQGLKHYSIIFEDATKLNEFMKFNKVLLDAPCSGSGTITKDQLESVTEDLVTRSSNIQKELLNKAINLVNVGDEIIYSTCSIFKVENEEVINKFIQEGRVEVVPITTTIDTLPSTIDGVLTIKPSELYEGFFVSKLKKLK
jgi:16S rRNA C967 or C1407 C5-methylase (RsmB/RsmF family)